MQLAQIVRDVTSAILLSIMISASLTGFPYSAA
jgi:hypothetical protein